MKLTFLGTRGNIEATTNRHRRHTSLLVSYKQRRVMIDCGEDWLDHVEEVSPHAIVITHAHPDHAWGLKQGAPCPVYATETAWEEMKNYPIENKHTVQPETACQVQGITFRAYTVEHSTRAPAIGYRVTAGHVSIFYAPDLVYIHKRAKALAGVKMYIGDGATLTRSFVRKRGEHLIGHTPFRTQLTWCQKEQVPQAVVTHCGSEIVAGDERSLIPKIQNMAKERGVDVRVAYDGLEIVLR